MLRTHTHTPRHTHTRTHTHTQTHTHVLALLKSLFPSSDDSSCWAQGAKRRTACVRGLSTNFPLYRDNFQVVLVSTTSEKFVDSPRTPAYTYTPHTHTTTHFTQVKRLARPSRTHTHTHTHTLTHTHSHTHTLTHTHAHTHTPEKHVRDDVRRHLVEEVLVHGKAGSLLFLQVALQRLNLQ